jgi:UDP-glucose:(heptosyl)LPS alpha-1,3-glucosyltransferase
LKQNLRRPNKLSCNPGFAGSLDLRICVISPFVDKQHGTERALAELLERLALRHQVQIDLYSQQVSDLSVTAPHTESKNEATIRWHRVPAIPGPHLFQFVWWYFANRWRRSRDGRQRSEPFDLVYSPGVNAPDVDAITVHITFRAFYESVRGQLTLLDKSPREWPRIIHRRLYYRLIMALERRIYMNSRVALSAVSQIAADQLERYFGRTNVLVVRHGVDTAIFNRQTRLARRDSARASFGIVAGEFAFLLIGNDWKKKGLDTLLTAIATCGDLPLRLLVIGKDSQVPFLEECQRLRIESRVRFADPSPDVMHFYAAADAYVGPSLEDAYGLPVLESMACGLPVIVSSAAGASEIVIHGENGFVLRDPRDAAELAVLIRKLTVSPELAAGLAAAGERTAAAESWDVHADKMYGHFKEVLAKKKQRATLT